ncbi:hypothetical protein [Dactylosporangium sp. NPDC051541]|uniref:hypothetical protein n=1 Tax=Dactylosporangium sp. NPDC051541 TaxID=3363977 RepID=UPI0037BDA9E6
MPRRRAAQAVSRSRASGSIDQASPATWCTTTVMTWTSGFHDGDRGVRRAGRGDALPSTVRSVLHGGAQGFVPVDDVAERGPQRRGVEHAGRPLAERQGTAAGRWRRATAGGRPRRPRPW